VVLQILQNLKNTQSTYTEVRLQKYPSFAGTRISYPFNIEQGEGSLCPT